MEFLLNRFRNLTVLLVVVMAQLLLLAYQVKGSQDVRLVRLWSVSAVTPIAKVMEVVRRNTIGVVEDYFVLINVREDNRRLEDELGKLKMENHFLKSELQTADRAQALRAFQARTPSRTVPARVIGTGTGANSRVVYVDRGTNAGIERGMAVVTPDGIVGKVLDSYPTASQVLLITDPSFAAGVISQKNRVHGTIKGLGQSKCLVDYVQNEEKVEPGEIFYTSGDDRIFPKGMPVGRVTVARAGKTFKEIFVVPNGLQNGLEEVLIVVQGEHQPIPDRLETASSSGIFMMNPPGDAAAPTPSSSSLVTEADRMREQYKEVGEAQGHQFGEGGPGSRPPNFNLRVQQPNSASPAPTTGAANSGPAASTAAGAIGAAGAGVPASQPQPGVTPTKPASVPPAAPAQAQTQVQGTRSSAPTTPRLGPDGQPIVTRVKPPMPSDGAPVVSKPKPLLPTTGIENQPPVSRTKPPVTVDLTPDAPATGSSQRRVVTNDSTINVITPAPKSSTNESTTSVPRTSDPPARPVGPPRTTGPSVPKPKPEGSETPANP